MANADDVAIEEMAFEDVASVMAEVAREVALEVVKAEEVTLTTEIVFAGAIGEVMETQAVVAAAAAVAEVGSAQEAETQAAKFEF